MRLQSYFKPSKFKVAVGVIGHAQIEISPISEHFVPVTINCVFVGLRDNPAVQVKLKNLVANLLASVVTTFGSLDET